MGPEEEVTELAAPAPISLHICYSLSLKSSCPDLSMADSVVRSQLKSNTLKKADPDSCGSPPTPCIASFEFFQRMHSHLKISYFKSKDLTPCSFLYLLNLERGLALIYLMGERQGCLLLDTPCLFQVTSVPPSRKNPCSLRFIQTDCILGAPVSWLSPVPSPTIILRDISFHLGLTVS